MCINVKKSMYLNALEYCIRMHTEIIALKEVLKIQTEIKKSPRNLQAHVVSNEVAKLHL